MDPNNLFPGVKICKRCHKMPAVRGRDYDSKCWQVIQAQRRRANVDVQKNLEKAIYEQKVDIACKVAQLDELKKAKAQALQQMALLDAVNQQLQNERVSVSNLTAEFGVTGMTGGAPPSGGGPTGSSGPTAGAAPTPGTTGPNIAYWNWLFGGSAPTGFTGGAPPTASFPSAPTTGFAASPPFFFGPTVANPGNTAAAPSAARVSRGRRTRPSAPPAPPPIVPPPVVLPPAPVPVQLAPIVPQSSPPSSPTSGVADLFHQVDIDGDDELLDYEPEQCTICQTSLEELDVGDEERILGCGHSFHKNCLNGWIASRINSTTGPTCPHCRAPIP